MTDENLQSLATGTVLNGKWVILDFIDKGGMGEIYRAHQINLKRDVAIKIVSKEWLQDIEEDEEEMENAFRRFRQEVLTMAQIRHPNVIQIYDFDKAVVEVSGEPVEMEYIALEYVPGRTLKDTMREEGFYPEEESMAKWLEDTFLPVLEGVSAIHASGILHRDLKPANVLMDGSIPKIADFGLARSCKLKSMTCSLEVKGSPAYMAPEQFIDFKGTDERTDIYSLGKILYEAADGKIPKQAIPFRQAQLKEAETRFYRDIDEIVRKATDENPGNRFQSVQELKDAVTEALGRFHSQAGAATSHQEHGIHLSRRTMTLMGVFALLLAGLLGFWAFHSVQEHFISKAAVESGQPSAKISHQPIIYPPELPRQRSAPDGSVLKLVPGGELHLPPEFAGGAGQVIRIKSFYMDETPVTNQQFVDFLNTVRHEITVKDGAVKRNGKLYLYLGEAVQGYEPIVFQDDIFKVKHSGHSACPVVRVTAYGADAYASFFNRRLPTSAEWLYAATDTRGVKGLPETLFTPINLPSPVMLFPENLLGIRGLNVHLGSWVTSVIPGSESENFSILGGGEAGEDGGKALPYPVRRKPWEAFEEVGFRCVQDI